MKPHASASGYGVRADTGGGASYSGAAVAVLFGLALGFVSWFLVGRGGMPTIVAMLGGSIVGTVVTFMSWRRSIGLVVIWIFTMSGFRAFAMISMPVLPDLSVERVAALWLLAIFAMRLVVRRDRVRGPFTLDFILLMHMLYILANVMVLGEGHHVHQWAISSVTPFLAYIIGKNMVYEDRDVKIVLYFLAGLSVYYAIQSVAQKYNLTFLVWPRQILERDLGLWPAGRSRGPFLHPPLFGQMMGMVLPFQFYLFFRVKSVAAKSILLVTIALGGLGLLFTYTRAPWVAALAGLATLAILRPRYRQMIIGLGGLIAAAMFFGALQFANSEFLQERVGNTGTIDNRLAALSAALRMWRDHPLFGIGFFNWEQFYPDYQRGEHIPFYGYITRLSGRGVVPHDIFWGRLAEEGLLSIGLLSSAIGIMWLRFRRLWDRVGEQANLNRDALAAIAAMFVAYLLGGMGMDYRYFDLVTALPYFFAGVLYGYEMPAPAAQPTWDGPYASSRSA
jgi:hypothetical protein